jgi:predicted RNA-binding protein
LSNNVVEEEDNEIQSLNKQDKEIESDETNENDNDNSDRSRAREVFEVVEERLRDSGIDFDISNMLD